MTNTSSSLVGRVCLLTGASGGMGRAIAVELARRGAVLELVCRTAEQGLALSRELVKLIGNCSINFLIADLSDQRAVRRLVEDFRGRHAILHILINNAGAHFRERNLSVDGIELHLAVNNLAPFLLTYLLVDALKADAPSRIVNVVSKSLMHSTLGLEDLNSERSFSPMAAYGRAKLAMLMTGYAFARRLGGTGVTLNAVHPGIVSTSIISDVAPPYARPFLSLIKPFLLSPSAGALPALYLASAPEIVLLTGAYFARTSQQLTSAESYDEDLQERLWQANSALVGLTA